MGDEKVKLITGGGVVKRKYISRGSLQTIWGMI